MSDWPPPPGDDKGRDGPQGGGWSAPPPPPPGQAPPGQAPPGQAPPAPPPPGGGWGTPSAPPPPPGGQPPPPPGGQPPPPPPGGGPDWGQQPGGWGQQQQPWQGQPQRKTSGLAIGALIVGIFALLLGWIPLLGWLIVLVGLVLGAVAIAKTKPPVGGRGLAIGGLVCSILGLLAAVGVVIAGIGSLNAFNEAIESGEFDQLIEELETEADAGVDQPVDGETVSVFDLEVGDCFNDPPEGFADEGIEEVPVVDCSQPHDNEVFALLTYPEPEGGEYPGESEVQTYSDQQCQGEAFTDYVGSDYATSRYFASGIYPTQGSWEQGDREIACILYFTEKLTGSAEGAGD